MDIEAELLEVCRNLLKRRPLRRGPYLISDADLKRTIRRLERGRRALDGESK
jgi:hypothetical protein